MKRIFELILAHPKLVLAAAVLIAALGWRVGKTLSVDIFPEIREPRVVVQTEAGGLTAEEVEQRVTIPIEAVMNGIPGVRKVRSSSGGGLSFVWVDFDWNVNLAQARFGVFERLASVREQLPPEVHAEIAPVVSITGEIMLVALTCPSGQTPLINIRELAEFDLRTRLLSVPGLGDIVVVGGHLPEYQVLASPRVLAQYGLSFADVIAGAEASRTMASAGYLSHVGGEEIPLRQIARADTLEALRRVTLPTLAEKPLRLGDVAEVRLGGAPRRGSASFCGEEAVLLSIQKAPGANTPEVTRQLDELLDQFAAAHAAEGIEVHREAYRQADFINLSIAEGKGIVRDAVLIVVLVLGLTLMRFRTILITLLTMPVSVLAGIAIFPYFDLGVNVMTLGGLAVGIGDIVDCAIIFVEIIWRRLGENALKPQAEREGTPRIIADAALEVLPSVMFSTLIIVLVFVPLLMLTGLESRFFAPLGLAYLFTFGASFVVAMALVPALSILLWREPKAPKGKESKSAESIAVRVMKAAYRPLLGVCLRFPKTLCLVMAALLAGTVYLASGFGASFLQTFREDAFTVFVSTPPGTSLAETERIGNNADEMIRGIPGVQTVLRRTGRAERDQHAEPPSASELVVRVDMKADANRIRETIRENLGEIPGVSTMVGYPIAHRISAALSGTEAELAINVFGEDLAVLRDVAKKVKAILETLPEVADVRANREIMVNTYRIDYDLEALAEMGLTLKDAGEQVSAAFNGKVVGEIRDGLKVRDLVVRLDPKGGEIDPETVRSLLIVSPTGKRQRLDEIAHVYREEASNLVIREQTRRKALITCNAAATCDTGSLVAALRKAIEPTVVAAGCTVSYGGSYEARQSAGRRLTALGIALLVAIFVLLTLALKTAKAAALVMLNVPLSLMGGVVAVQVTNPVLSVASLIGFVTVVGFVLRNGLLLLNRYRELEEAGLFPREAIEQGSTERMVPILMTSLTTILGLVPIVLAADKPGGELLAPLAIVQFGGLISATILNMLVLPAVTYLCSERKGNVPMKTTGLCSLLIIALVIAGCKSYEEKPVDWTTEETAWRDTSAKLAFKSLHDVETVALVANPELNRLRLKAMRTGVEAESTGWWEDPELDFDFLRILDSTDYRNIFGASLAFKLPLSGAPYFEGKAKERYAETDALVVQAKERSVRVEARRKAIAYAAALARERTLRSALEDVAVKKARANVEALFGQGEVDEFDFSTVRRMRHERLHQLHQVELEAEKLRGEFAAVLGVMPSVEIVPPADALGEHDHGACDVTVPLPAELAKHLEVRAALARLGGSEEALHAQIRKQYPDLTLGPAYAREDGMNRLGLVAGLTLPLWNRNRKGIAEAESVRDLDRDQAIRVWRELVSGSIGAARVMKVLASRQEPNVRDRKVADRLHETGEATDLVYLSFVDEITEAELDRIECRERFAEAEAELERYRIDS